MRASASAAEAVVAAAATAAAAATTGTTPLPPTCRRRSSLARPPRLLALLPALLLLLLLLLHPPPAADAAQSLDEKTAHALTAGVQERLVAQERLVGELRAELQELPARLEAALARRFAASAAASVRALVLDPVQAAVLNRTLSGADSFLGARMVRFEGQELLILAPQNDEFVGGSILHTGRPYDGGMLRTLLSLVRPGSTVVDAGGNIGSYTAHLAAQAGPQGRVYAFEPQRKMFMVLCANAAVNSLLNVFPQNVALSFAPGEITMSSKVPDGSSAGVDIAAAERAHALVNYGGMSMGVGGERALARTLDWYNLTDVSLIKVDVQGAEPLMFWGARETIKRSLPAVAFEDTPEEFRVSDSMRAALGVPDEVMAFDFKAFFASLGYTSHSISSVDRLFLPPDHPAADRLSHASLQWGVDQGAPVVVVGGPRARAAAAGGPATPRKTGKGKGKGKGGGGEKNKTTTRTTRGE